MYMILYMYMCIYIPKPLKAQRPSPVSRPAGKSTPGLHNKIPAHKIFARVWVAQKSFLFIGSG